jgi:hypothetical protein
VGVTSNERQWVSLGERRRHLWDNPRHAVSCGYVLRTSTPLPVASVGFAMQGHFLVPRVHHKRDRAFEFGGVLANVESRGGIWVGQVELEGAATPARPGSSAS